MRSDIPILIIQYWIIRTEFTGIMAMVIDKRSNITAVDVRVCNLPMIMNSICSGNRWLSFRGNTCQFKFTFSGNLIWNAECKYRYVKSVFGINAKEIEFLFVTHMKQEDVINDFRVTDSVFFSLGDARRRTCNIYQCAVTKNVKIPDRRTRNGLKNHRKSKSEYTNGSTWARVAQTVLSG